MALTTQGETLDFFPATITVSSQVRIRERRPAKQRGEAQAETPKQDAAGGRDTRFAPVEAPARRGPVSF